MAASGSAFKGTAATRKRQSVTAQSSAMKGEIRSFHAEESKKDEEPDEELLSRSAHKRQRLDETREKKIRKASQPASQHAAKSSKHKQSVKESIDERT